MKSDTPLDYAVLQLSPKRSRCELLVSTHGNTEKLASGSVKPFVTHLKVAEEQVALAVQSIKLEVEKSKNAATWFTKGTLERFVRFVSTPEVLELVNTYDAEMSQLEAARKIYSQGGGDQHPGALGGAGAGITAAADATKKELLRAIDVRFVAVKQDLTTACARASAAGFNPDTVSDLHVFADRFGAHRLNEACSKFISLFHRRPELISQWKPGVDDRAVRSSCESDMSIDDPTEDPSGSLFRSQNKQEQQLDPSQSHLDQSRLSMCQQPQSIATFFPAQHNVNGKNEAKEESQEVSEKDKKEEAQNDSPFSSAPAGPPARRLSVQDRINLFENKQKESSGGSGGKPIVGKSVELRRLSSDVSAVPERAVLRRWSGASDMSIDLSGDKKDLESPLCTPSSASSLSQAKSNNIVLGGSEGKEQKGLNDSANSSKVETRSGFVRVGDGDLKDQAEGQTQVRFSLGKEEDWGSKLNCNSKEQAVSQPQSRSSTPQRVSQEKLNLNSEERSSGFKDQVSSATQLRGFSDQIIGVKNQVGKQTQIGSFASKAGDVSSDSRFVNKVESELVGKSVNQSRPRGFPSHSRSLSGQFDFGSGSKLKEAFASQLKRVEGDQLPPQPQVRSFVGELEGGEIDVKASYEQQLMDEDSGGQKMKFQKQVSSRREQIKKSHGRRDESSLAYENSNLDFTAKKVSVNQESFSTVSKPPVEQVQRVRQTKGNQELNDELKMKANELEKLFAEHKLRVPGDQSSSARRNKPADIQVEEGASSQYKKAAAEEIVSPQLLEKVLVIESSSSSSNMENFYTPPPMKMAVNQDYGDTLRQNFSELGLSDDSRGKSYEIYMQKRDAKLREEWGSKRVEKEAKLKAMQDSLERSRAELKAKFSGSADRQDSVSSARLPAEKLRSFNLQSSIKREQSIDSILSEEDEDLSEIPGQKLYGQDRSFTESSTGDGASRTTQSKKVLPYRNVSSSTPRTAVSPAPRSSAKLSNSSSGRRKVQSENPLAQSVPNFSDFRKENTKPSSGVSKTVTRPQRNYARSKSTSEEIPMIKEEKPRRSQSVRKSVANPVEYKDMSPLAPLDQIEQSPYEKFPKSVESKPFLRKGNGIGPGSGASIAKLKASIAPEALRNEEFDELEFEAEDSMDMVQEDEEQEEVETMEVEDCINVDNGKPRLSQESDKSGNSGSDNGDSLRSLSQADPASAAEEPATMPSAFHSVGSHLDSPGESPMSWNARIQYPFSYPHETSDIEASADSPIGSPASWNSHGLAQAEADAARMRKKWGSAQKPVVINSSHNQPRKDMTKGFKRLLKFGRKSRGTESLVDWISATTSEGDDDTEDGRDLTSRFSEDLRKSRMGFLPGDESYNESEYIEQDQSLQTSIPTPPGNFKPRDDPLSGSSLKAPRSFFFSSFRSKAGDSKLR